MSLQYSEFTPNIENDRKNKHTTRNQTLKNRRKEPSIKVKQFLDAIDSDDDNSLHSLHKNDTDEPSQPKMYNSFTPTFSNNAKEPNNETIAKDNEDNDITTETFNNLQSNYSTDYYNKLLPYYNQLANSQEVSGEKDLLLEKLNYMIHLLEEQQEEKTGHITEELILYTFLGVFVIFIVDSFARAGKYVR